ncbi:hypothetical protein [Bacillus sp. CGMCC 1.16541]|uniref:hypothetical protein n=1 Tax=Bacillus sp. CGMCC 1.16541 TaxID=2185143 RepID=UPI000D72B70E|nr:hypothetical protein [Bacillus sp. CGMCC 1.16541]
MSVFQTLYDLTKSLHTHVGTTPLEEERDEYIARVDELLEARQALLPHIVAPMSVEEKKQAQDMIKMNHEIDQALVIIKEHVAIDIRKLKTKKTQADRYVNPYVNVSFDGTFYDKKK